MKKLYNKDVGEITSIRNGDAYRCACNKFYKARERKAYCNILTTDNAVQLFM